jgi:hypothetical protein
VATAIGQRCVVDGRRWAVVDAAARAAGWRKVRCPEDAWMLPEASADRSLFTASRPP